MWYAAREGTRESLGVEPRLSSSDDFLFRSNRRRIRSKYDPGYHFRHMPSIAAPPRSKDAAAVAAAAAAASTSAQTNGAYPQPHVSYEDHLEKAARLSEMSQYGQVRVSTLFRFWPWGPRSGTRCFMCMPNGGTGTRSFSPWPLHRNICEKCILSRMAAGYQCTVRIGICRAIIVNIATIIRYAHVNAASSYSNAQKSFAFLRGFDETPWI